MPDLPIVPSEVAIVGSPAATPSGNAGEAITAGEPCFIKAADDKVYPACCGLDDEAATFAGIATADAAVDTLVALQSNGSLTLGATAAMVADTMYVVSRNPGKIMRMVDLVMGDRAVVLGTCGDANTLDLP